MSYFMLSRDQVKLFTDFMSNVRPGVELEIRLGNFIYNKETKKSNFVSNVEIDFFYRLKHSFYKSGIVSNNVNSTEYIYETDKGRVKKIISNDGKETIMLKNTFKKYDVYDYDFRLSLARETIIKTETIHESHYLIRDKKRTSFILPFGSLDLTVVKEISKTGETQTKHEIELEITQNVELPRIEQILAVILQTRQDNFFVISNFERRNVINQYKQLVNSYYFIGSQPETLQKNGLANLYKERYSVTDKADGERMMLFITSSKDVYFIDSNLNRVLKTNIKSEGGYYSTLMDGELVVNDSSNKMYFLVFDLMVYNGKDIRGNDQYMLDTRINRFNHIVTTLSFTELYKVESKKFYYKNVFLGSEKLLDDATKKFYKNDGLIFTPMDEPYPLTRKWQKLLKWKPADLNTIDFYSVKIDDTTWELYVQHTEQSDTKRTEGVKRQQSEKVLFDIAKLCPTANVIDRMTFTTTFDSTQRDPVTKEQYQSNTVIEYKWDTVLNKFVPLKTRWDKTANPKKHGNFSTVACDVWNNIHSPIQKEDLFRFTVFSNSKQDFFFERMRKSHNKVKEYLYNKYTYNCEYLLELCSGRGGDLHKWLFNNVKNVSGYDICLKSIAECKKRIQQTNSAITNNYKFFPLDLCSDNASKIIKQNANSRLFNTVCCQFGVHYFFKSESTFSSLLNILNSNLQDNGLFIVTFMDNKKLEELLSQNCSKDVDNEIAYYIKKNNSTNCNFGNELRIVLGGGMSNVLSQGSDEYIIDFDFFVQKMKENNYQVIDTALFESFGFDLTDVEKDISNLNRYCIFQKLSTQTNLPFQVIKTVPVENNYKTIQLPKQNLSLYKVSSTYDVIDVLNCIEYKFYKQRSTNLHINTFDDIQTFFNDIESSYQPLFVDLNDQCVINLNLQITGLDQIVYFTFHKHVVESTNDSNTEFTEYNNWYIVLQNGKILFQPEVSNNSEVSNNNEVSNSDKILNEIEVSNNNEVSNNIELSNNNEVSNSDKILNEIEVSSSDKILNEISCGKITVKRLKELSASLGLKTTGKKDELQQRLERHCKTFSF
jgi:hypothetical protein